jgi:hypothetical protein
MSRPQAMPVVLRTAAVWGTTVIKAGSLVSGQSLECSDAPEAFVAKPDGSPMADFPIRGVAAGWELDARGATGGEVVLRGRRESPAALAASGAPIPIVAGDYGVVQYGNFSVFFQFAEAVPALKKKRRFDWGFILSFIFAMIAAGGGLALMWAITTPRGIPKPIELTSQADLLAQLNLKPEDIPPPPEVGQQDKGSGVPDPGAKDTKPQGGGKKIKGAEGKLGKQGPEKETKMTGDPAAGLGGMAEALNSEVGDEVKKTLGTISSVADALGGLRSDSIVLGQGSGTGLRGGGPGGGGIAEGGVPFGSGTLDTGWGPGKGGGFGSGSGGPGGRGLGGPGKGGLGGGEGSGTGDGERKVAGGGVAKAGQGLSPEQIRRVVMSRQGAFQACYEIALSKDPGAKGGVTVGFSISPGGDVASANVSHSSLGNERAEGCMMRVFNRLKFPSADKATNASFPFVFKGK